MTILGKTLTNDKKIKNKNKNGNIYTQLDLFKKIVCVIL